MEIQCPNCGSVNWNAVETFQSLTPCRLIKTDSGVETEYNIRAEHVRDASTSVVTVYICGQDECGFTVEPLNLDELGGQHDHG
jgi:hypothetical protein